MYAIWSFLITPSISACAEPTIFGGFRRAVVIMAEKYPKNAEKFFVRYPT